MNRLRHTKRLRRRRCAVQQGIATAATGAPSPHYYACHFSFYLDVINDTAVIPDMLCRRAIIYTIATAINTAIILYCITTTRVCSAFIRATPYAYAIIDCRLGGHATIRFHWPLLHTHTPH